MTLAEKIRARMQEAEDQMSVKEHIRRAERLSEKFKDVEPESYSVPMEKYYGLPAFQTEKMQD